ncbi:MAG: DUF6328 family protein [Acidimicrobiia bacterium]
MADNDSSAKNDVDQQLTELLDELRVAIPGVEVLFAFLLGVAFTQRFETLTAVQEGVYFGTLLCTAAATALLIAPSAHHRIRSGDDEKERVLAIATRLAIGGLVLVMLSVAGVVFLVADLLYGLVPAVVATGSVAGWFGWFWFGLPLRRMGSS